MQFHKAMIYLTLSLLFSFLHRRIFHPALLPKVVSHVLSFFNLKDMRMNQYYLTSLDELLHEYNLRLRGCPVSVLHSCEVSNTEQFSKAFLLTYAEIQIFFSQLIWYLKLNPFKFVSLP